MLKHFFIYKIFFWKNESNKLVYGKLGNCHLQKSARRSILTEGRQLAAIVVGLILSQIVDFKDWGSLIPSDGDGEVRRIGAICFNVVVDLGTAKRDDGLDFAFYNCP